MGDTLLQKKFTVDFLSKKCKKNEGEVPQYYVEGDYEAIIPPRTFDLVQSEMARRAGQKERYSGSSIFSSKIKCGQCGSWYGAKVWHSTDKYRKVVYRCNSKFKNEEKCTTPHVSEEEIKAAFVKSVNSLISDKQEIITNLELVCETLSDTSGLEAQRAGLAEEINLLADKVKECVMENASVAQDQEAYKSRYNALAEQYSDKKDQYDELSETIKTRKSKREALEEFINDLRA